MKYPTQQFELLLKSIKVLKEIGFDVQGTHPVSLHYLIYQQGSEGQKHNAIVKTLYKGAQIRWRHPFN